MALKSSIGSWAVVAALAAFGLPALAGAANFPQKPVYLSREDHERVREAFRAAAEIEENAEAFNRDGDYDGYLDQQLDGKMYELFEAHSPALHAFLLSDGFESFLSAQSARVRRQFGGELSAAVGDYAALQEAKNPAGAPSRAVLEREAKVAALMIKQRAGKARAAHVISHILNGDKAGIREKPLDRHAPALINYLESADADLRSRAYNAVLELVKQLQGTGRDADWSRAREIEGWVGGLAQHKDPGVAGDARVLLAEVRAP